MTDPVRINPGLLRRIDIFAVARPDAANAAMRTVGCIGMVAALGLLFCVVAERWEVALLNLATSAMAGGLWLLERRAICRVPETKRWLDDLVARG